MLRRLALWTLVLFALFPSQIFGGDRVTVMTRNVYLGADLAPVIQATTFEEFVFAVTATYAQVQATRFPERAVALAAEIKVKKPDFIGLQEVALWRSQFPSDLTTPATHVEYDFLQLLLDALRNDQLTYTPLIVATRADVEAPGITASGLKDYRMTIRDVLLVRTSSDEPRKQIEILGVNGSNFVTNLQLPTVAGPITFIRGWVSADVEVDETTFRVINTHLESFAEPVRLAQAVELLAGPANTHLPVILIGDLNSAPGTAPYQYIVGAGFADAAVIEGEEGFTCCQRADVLNDVSQLDSRIDLVLLRGDLSSRDLRRVGHRTKDRTASGLWPSDHAGVIAEVEIEAQ